MNQQKAANHVVRGSICALVGGVLWAFSGSCVQFLTIGYNIAPMWLTSVRMLFSATLFLVAALIAEPKTLLALLRDWRSVLGMLIFGVFGVSAMQITYTFSISYVGAGIATVLEQLALIIILAVTCLKSKRLPHTKEVVGIIAAFLGMICIATQGSFEGINISHLGFIWGLLSAVGYASYVIIPERLLEKWGSLVVTGMGLFFGGVVMSLFVQPWKYQVAIDLPAVGAFAGIVLLGTLGAYMFYLQGIKDAGPVRASLLCCIEPVAAMIISFIWLGNPISVFDIIGCALILGMVFLITNKSVETVAKNPEEFVSQSFESSLFKGSASDVGFYSDRIALEEDFPIINSLLDQGYETKMLKRARKLVKKYPSQEKIKEALALNKIHVIENEEGDIIGMYAFDLQGDKNYQNVQSGSWLSEKYEESAESIVYAALQWLVVRSNVRHAGVGRYILDRVDAIAKEYNLVSVRTDVMPSNEPLKQLLSKQNYQECGVLVFRNHLGMVRKRAMFEKLYK